MMARPLSVFCVQQVLIAALAKAYCLSGLLAEGVKAGDAVLKLSHTTANPDFNPVLNAVAVDGCIDDCFFPGRPTR
jgi:hypothetical protein